MAAALSRDPEGRNPWNVVYVFYAPRDGRGVQLSKHAVLPSGPSASAHSGHGMDRGGRFSDPVEFLGGQQRQALADWFSHVRNGMLQAQDLQPNHCRANGRCT